MEGLDDVIHIAVRFLDNIIDINKFPDKIYENYQKNMRTIGLGYTGLGDMLAMMGLKYNTPKARSFVRELMEHCAFEAYKASIALAQEKGAFPFCDNEAHAAGAYVRNLLDSEQIALLRTYGIRNAKIQSVAPCGTISLTYGNNCSSGIEPIFSLDYERKVKVGGQEDENSQTVHLMDYAYWLYHKLKAEGKQLDVGEDVFVTALEMTVDEHVDMLAAIANHTDMSVSKTINVPTDYSFEDTQGIYWKCWHHDIKGCTIFRPNAIRQGVLIDSSTKTEAKNVEPVTEKRTLQRGDIIECSNELVGKKRKLTTGCGSLHVLAFFDPVTAEMQEVYLNKGSTGGCANYMTGLSRMISLLCRAGVNVYAIKDQLDSTGTCPSYATRKATKGDTSRGSCCPMAIGNALVDMYEEMLEEVVWDDCEDRPAPTRVAQTPVQQVSEKMVCPECGEPLVFEGGCNSCKSCGYSKCG